jgi:polyhydroxybutyrate depolymerase
VAFAEVVLDWAEENLCIDPARVFSTGYSGGARTSSRFACALPQRIRAIAPVAGVRHDPPCDVSGMPVLTLHGTADGTNLYDGCDPADTACSRNGEWVEGVEAAIGDWRAANGCAEAPRVEPITGEVERRTWSDCRSGADVIFYRVAGGTHTWQLVPNTSELILDFFLAQPPR